MQEITAVLFSGGLDSAVLLARAAQEGPVQPIYVSVGLAWEAEERRTASRASCRRSARPPTCSRWRPLRVDMTDVYPPTHWAIRGEAPAFDTPDEDVYLEGRNIVLLSKAAVFMARAKIRRVCDRPARRQSVSPTPPTRFFDAFAQALSIGLASADRDRGAVRLTAQGDVIRLGRELDVPLELTLSCMQPEDGPALRTLQQVPRAQGRVLESGRGGSDDVCGRGR